jgi:hypothetical protein
MRAGVGQNILDHTFGGVTCGLVLLEDNKDFQSSVNISSSLTIHIDLSYISHSTGERTGGEVQPDKYDEYYPFT